MLEEDDKTILYSLDSRIERLFRPERTQNDSAIEDSYAMVDLCRS